MDLRIYIVVIVGGSASVSSREKEMRARRVPSLESVWIFFLLRSWVYQKWFYRGRRGNLSPGAGWLLPYHPDKSFSGFTPYLAEGCEPLVAGRCVARVLTPVEPRFELPYDHVSPDRHG